MKNPYIETIHNFAGMLLVDAVREKPSMLTVDERLSLLRSLLRVMAEQMDLCITSQNGDDDPIERFKQIDQACEDLAACINHYPPTKEQMTRVLTAIRCWFPKGGEA